MMRCDTASRSEGSEKMNILTRMDFRLGYGIEDRLGCVVG